jgi:alpha-beta hydrolase superfamily lysophospholipase
MTNFKQLRDYMAAVWDEGDLRPHGLILIAPAVRAQALPPIPDVPTVVHVGDQDWAIEGVELLAQVMDQRGTPLRVERIAGFGHAMPEDLPAVVQRGLDWISSVRTDEPTG